jgi:hypothetical protein
VIRVQPGRHPEWETTVVGEITSIGETKEAILGHPFVEVILDTDEDEGIIRRPPLKKFEEFRQECKRRGISELKGLHVECSEYHIVLLD